VVTGPVVVVVPMAAGPWLGARSGDRGAGGKQGHDDRRGGRTGSRGHGGSTSFARPAGPSPGT
jgi:hypothetical protein